MKKTMLLAGLVVVLVAGCDNKPVIPPMPASAMPLSNASPTPPAGRSRRLSERVRRKSRPPPSRCRHSATTTWQGPIRMMK